MYINRDINEARITRIRALSIHRLEVSVKHKSINYLIHISLNLQHLVAIFYHGGTMGDEDDGLIVR